MTEAIGRTVPFQSPIRRICVVRFGGMGDILLATPAVRTLSRHFGTTDIDFIVGRGMKPALEGIPYLREIIPFDKEGEDARLRRFVPFLRALSERRYDLFVNFQPSLKTGLMALATHAPHTITFHKDRRRQPETGRVRHAVDDFTKDLRGLGIAHVDDRHLDFAIPSEAHARVATLLTEAGITSGDALLVVNPAATRDINRWPPEKFVVLFDTLADRLPHVRIAITGGPGDVALSQAILGATRCGDGGGNGGSNGIINFAGRLSVKELGALLARADTVLTADTGPMHIASAVGAPLVVLSGAADPDRTGPLSPRDLVVINRDLPCVPCQGRTCKRGDIACMTQMPVEWVLRAVERRLREKTFSPSPPGPLPHAVGEGESKNAIAVSIAALAALKTSALSNSPLPGYPLAGGGRGTGGEGGEMGAFP